MSTISSGTTSTTTLIHSGDTTGSLVFKTNDTGSGGTTAMTIDTSQNVGIGTASPWSQISSYGASGATTQFIGFKNADGGDIRFGKASGVDNTCIVGTWTSNRIKFYTNSTNVMDLDTSGNLLVGTTTTTNNIRLNEKFAVVTTGSGVYGGISNTSYNGTTASIGPIFDFQRSRGTTDGSMTAVASGDKLGYMVFRGADGTSFVDSAYITSEVDSTVSTNIVPGRLQFYTYNTAGSPVECMRINSSGNVLVACTALPSASVTGWGFDKGGGYARSAVGTTANSYQYLFYNPNGLVGSINTSGSSCTYNSPSDYRLKENIAPMTGALDKVAQLKPVTYTWKVDGSDGQGFIAHELQAVVPDCVTGEKDAVDADGNPVYQGIDTSFLVATLTAAIQELKAINDQQAQTITALTARIEALENK